MDEYESLTVYLADGTPLRYDNCKAVFREESGALIVTDETHHHVFCKGRWVKKRRKWRHIE
jgi:hypothetical protein